MNRKKFDEQGILFVSRILYIIFCRICVWNINNFHAFLCVFRLEAKNGVKIKDRQINI